MKIILLGAPGAGKGTLAQKLKADHGFVHISTGDILRENISQKTPIGLQAKKLIDNGNLVPDEIILKLLMEKINSINTDDYIIDGFPRTLAQAKSLDKILKVDYVLSLTASPEVVIDRLLNRLTCPNCKKITNRKRLKDDLCPVCNTKLDLRADDNEDAIRKRLKIYNENSKDILDFYKKLNILYEIDSDKSPEKTYELTNKIIRVKYDYQEK